MPDDIQEEIAEETVEKQSTEESFADLFEAYDNKISDDIRVGDKIRGEVISIGRDSVFMDTGTRIDGVVEKGELLDKEGELSCKVGDGQLCRMISRKRLRKKRLKRNRKKRALPTCLRHMIIN